MSAHRLTAPQVKQVKLHASENEEDLDNLSGSMEDIVDGYDCYDTNLWQSGTLPLLHGTCYVLVDDQNEIISRVEKFENSNTGPKFETAQKPSYLAKRGKGNVLVFIEEHKGTTAVWEIESGVTPEEKDLTFKLENIRIDDEDTLYVASVLYKGEPLERNYDEEMLNGKAAYSKLL